MPVTWATTLPPTELKNERLSSRSLRGRIERLCRSRSYFRQQFFEQVNVQTTAQTTVVDTTR